MYEYLIENEISWFDAPEIKHYKEQVLNSLNREEKEYMTREKAEMYSLYVSPEELPMEDYPDDMVVENADFSLNAEIGDEERHVFFEKNETVLQVIKENSKKDDTFNSLRVVTQKPIVGWDVIRQGPYVYDEGLLYYAPNENGHRALVGNFSIFVQRENCKINEIVNEQNQVIDREEWVTWNVSVLCMGEQYVAEVTVMELLSEKELLKITHDRAYLEPEKEAKKAYRRYVNYLIAEKKYASMVHYPVTGWVKHSDRKWIYLTNAGAIGHPELNVYSAAPYSFAYDEHRIGSTQIFEEFWNLRNLCPRKLAHSVFLMHFSCLAILTTLFQEAGHGVNFVVALIGPTNSQKTSVAVVFSRLFDRSSKSIPDIRFNSTEVAILEKMDTYGDAILLVDDLLPYGNKQDAKEQLKKSETIIRSYGDRVPRKRSKAYAQMNGLPEYNRVKGCCIMTGEVFEANCESSLTRVVQLPFERGDVDLNLLTFYQENLLNVPTFLYDFICYAGEHVEQIFQLIKTSVKDVRADVNLQIRTPRFRDTIGIFRAEIALFYQYSMERGFLSMAECKEAAKMDESMIRQIVCFNDVNTKVLSPATVILFAMKKGLDYSRLIRIGELDVKGVHDFSNIVIDNENFMILLPDTLWHAYETYCREQRMELLFNTPRKLIDPLKKEDAILIKEEGGRLRGTLKLSASTEQRFLYIRKEKYIELTKVLEEF